jgi:cytochrome c oxidase cbb3-type subunit 2
MNHGSRIFLSAFLTLATSWCGLVLVPQLQLGRQLPVVMKPPSPDYPSGRPGLAQQGLQVYRSLGCGDCHTQRVRPDSADIDRGWGQRRTVAQDFLFDQPVPVGALRIGPDLANLAARKPEDFATTWKYRTSSNQVSELTLRLYLHLYNPAQVSPGSTMPAYRYLFDLQELRPGNALAAIPLGGKKATQQLVPKSEAQALIAYLLSLRADVSLFEAPLPPKISGQRTPAIPKAPAAVTNTAAVKAGDFSK